MQKREPVNKKPAMAQRVLLVWHLRVEVPVRGKAKIYRPSADKLDIKI